MPHREGTGTACWQCVVPKRKLHVLICQYRVCVLCVHLQEISPFLRVLGTYPMDTELGLVSNDQMLAQIQGGSAEPANN